MTATSHAVTGALVATVVKQPFLAIPLAFFSHFICDALPHLGFEDFKFGSRRMVYWLAIDGTLVSAILLTILLTVANPWLLIVGALAAMSPDFMWLYHGLRGRTEMEHDKLTKFHGSIQKYEKPLGIVVDILWSLTMILGIVKLQ